MRDQPQSPTRGDAIDLAIMGVEPELIAKFIGNSDAAKAKFATRSIQTADRRNTLAALVLTCDPAMLTALEGVMGLRGPGE